VKGGCTSGLGRILCLKEAVVQLVAAAS